MYDDRFPDVRICKISLSNFYNIENAEIQIPNGDTTNIKKQLPSVLGVFGQNGSGKTSLLIAVEVLKTLLSGQSINKHDYSHCVMSKKSSAELEFEFSASSNDIDFYLSYSFQLLTKASSDKKTASFLNAETFDNQEKTKIHVANEILRFSARMKNGKRIRKQVLIDTSYGNSSNANIAFGNNKKYKELTSGSIAGVDNRLLQLKRKVLEESSSFLFNREVLSILTNSTKNPLYSTILNTLASFGKDYLFVLRSNELDFENDMIIPPSFGTQDKLDIDKEYEPIYLYRENKVTEAQLSVQKKVIDAISEVVSIIIPEFEMEYKEVNSNESFDKRSEETETHQYMLYSVKRGMSIPLKFESEGIKRIIAIIVYVIAVYNCLGFTLIVDDIDKHIFEFLFGELLMILTSSSKGQFIFTSHNLRALEVLPSENLLFTSTNPNNRFVKLKDNIVDFSLRDFYYLRILLDNDANSIYRSASSYDIEKTLYNAGTIIGE